MTSEELVKSMLEADVCELYDRVRIAKLFTNAGLGFGKLLKVDDERISITHNVGKNKKITYFIPINLLTGPQLNQI